jgi:cell division protein FtsL
MKHKPDLARIVLTDVFVHHRALLLLLTLVLLSAMAVIWNAHQYRQRNAEIARESKVARQLDVEWRQLRLEHRALADHARIEQLARERLSMHPVRPENETVVP